MRQDTVVDLRVPNISRDLRLADDYHAMGVSDIDRSVILGIPVFVGISSLVCVPIFGWFALAITMTMGIPLGMMCGLIYAAVYDAVVPRRARRRVRRYRQQGRIINVAPELRSTWDAAVRQVTSGMPVLNSGERDRFDMEQHFDLVSQLMLHGNALRGADTAHANLLRDHIREQIDAVLQPVAQAVRDEREARETAHHSYIEALVGRKPGEQPELKA